MKSCAVVLIVALAGGVQAREDGDSAPGAPCSDGWYRWVEERVPTGDGQGHGPDVGSDEWKGAVEFRLGVRDRPNVPDRSSQRWCEYIDVRVRDMQVPSSDPSVAGAPGTARGPSYPCNRVEAGSIEAMICADEELSALDRQLDDVYRAAARKAANQHPPQLRAEQRGWIKGRNECWKSSDERACVRDSYRLRIAELQARYRLVPGSGPVRFICEDNPANEVIVTFFRTDPATLIAERGDSVSLMYVQPGASGTMYRGRNEIFWEHQGEALITWGYAAPEMRCKRV